MEPTDELFPFVKMPPKRAYKIEISTPGRIAALEAEVERLRGLLARFTDKCALATVPYLPIGVQCRHCGENWGYGRPDRHTADCIVTLARAALEPQP